MKIMNLMHKNQFIIEHNDEIFFQSYKSIIAKIDKNKNLTICKDYNYSATTSRHLKIFLQHYIWNNSAIFDELIKKYSVSKSIDKMIEKGYIIKGW